MSEKSNLPYQLLCVTPDGIIRHSDQSFKALSALALGVIGSILAGEGHRTAWHLRVLDAVFVFRIIIYLITNDVECSTASVKSANIYIPTKYNTNS
jgi:uncharacterized membrane protein (DUF441 family)